MRKFKGLLCSVSMAAVMMMAGFSVCAEETEVTEAAVETTAASPEITADDGISPADQEALASYAQSSIEMVVTMTDAQIQEQIQPTTLLAVVNESVASSLQSWMDMKDDLGAYVATKAHDITVTDDDIIIKTTCDFENMEGIVTTTLSRDELSMEGMNFSTGDTSFGVKMKEAALNTVMGMGVVFTVLIFLSFLISLFKYVSKLENAISKKAAPAAAPTPAPAPAAPAPVEEETIDDGELIAVIAAAIAAAEGTSTDGFVVRSIKKHNRKKWQRA